MSQKQKPMCYGEAKVIRDTVTARICNDAAVKLYNGRVVLNEVRSKLKWERPVLAKNDPCFETINDKLMKLKALSTQNKLLK